MLGKADAAGIGHRVVIDLLGARELWAARHLHDEARRAEVVWQAARDDNLAHCERVAVVFAADVFRAAHGLCDSGDERHGLFFGVVEGNIFAVLFTQNRFAVLLFTSAVTIAVTPQAKDDGRFVR